MKLRFGPGILVAAAFVGPGTIAACSKAGAQFGFALLWALLFAVVATIILQEMSARLGIATQQGLSEVIRDRFSKKPIYLFLAPLIVIALFIGNSAYEGGNIAGAVLGTEGLALPFSKTVLVLIITGVALVLLLIGRFKIIVGVLTFCVILMSVTFLWAAISAGPEILAVLKGLFVPKIPSGSMWSIIALIGTTVVPYNLFLHAAATAKTYDDSPNDLKLARRDNWISIGLGGIISMAILITAATALFAQQADFSGQTLLSEVLKPLLGSNAQTILSIGFIAAGLTSTITAPLATAYACTGLMNNKVNEKSPTFKLIAIIVLLIGAGIAISGYKPLSIILVAQIANGLLLPFISILLMVMMNDKKVMGDYVNGTKENVFGILIICFTVFLGLKSILQVFNVI